jgi:hypothetical protein
MGGSSGWRAIRTPASSATGTMRVKNHRALSHRAASPSSRPANASGPSGRPSDRRGWRRYSSMSKVLRWAPPRPMVDAVRKWPMG